MTKEQIAELRARAKSIAKYHTEQASYGGASREFHVYAETLLGADVPALLDELERVASVAEEATAVLDEIEGYSNCSDLGADIVFDARRELQRRAREKAAAEAKKKGGAS